MSKVGGPMIVSYEISDPPDRWELSEDKVPESAPHDLSVELARQQLDAWILRTGRNAITYRNIAIRWLRERPRTGFDPDVCLVEPRPPEGEELESLLLWQAGRTAPRLAIEVVGKKHPYKDYAETPDKCGACGIAEVIVFDPHMKGPRAGGGPHRIQVWRVTEGRIARSYGGPGPAWCASLDAWVHAVDRGKRLRFADDEAGQRIWLTGAETANAEVERTRAELAEAERRIADLEKALAKAPRG